MTKTATTTHHNYQLTKFQGLSSIAALLQFGRTPLEFSLKCAQEYGDIVFLNIGSTKTCFLNHPNLIDEVLNKQNQALHQGYQLSSIARCFG